MSTGWLGGLPIESSTLSHSSMMKCRTEPNFRLPSFTSCTSAHKTVSLWSTCLPNAAAAQHHNQVQPQQRDPTPASGGQASRR